MTIALRADQYWCVCKRTIGRGGDHYWSGRGGVVLLFVFFACGWLLVGCVGVVCLVGAISLLGCWCFEGIVLPLQL